MKNKRKGFWEFFIEDAIHNPPFFATATITDVDADNNEIHITFADNSGALKAAKCNVENTAGYNIGDMLDIKVCGGIFPAIFLGVKKMVITKQIKKNQKKKVKVCRTFAERFKEQREKQKLTLSKIAKELGISRQSAVYYAMGDRIPTIMVLLQLSELLDTSIDYLVGRSDEPQ